MYQVVVGSHIVCDLPLQITNFLVSDIFFHRATFILQNIAFIFGRPWSKNWVIVHQRNEKRKLTKQHWLKSILGSLLYFILQTNDSVAFYCRKNKLSINNLKIIDISLFPFHYSSHFTKHTVHIHCLRLFGESHVYQAWCRFYVYLYWHVISSRPQFDFLQNSRK